jgi:hypothetical protein
MKEINNNNIKVIELKIDATKLSMADSKALIAILSIPPMDV